MGVLPFNDLLQAHGYNTLQSVDGADTVELARKHHPDLVVMDIQLPKVSGLDRTKELKADADLKDIPVLAVTAFALDGGIERILDAGCEDAIGKPISVPCSLRLLKNICSNPLP